MTTCITIIIILILIPVALTVLPARTWALNTCIVSRARTCFLTVEHLSNRGKAIVDIRLRSHSRAVPGDRVGVSICCGVKSVLPIARPSTFLWADALLTSSAPQGLLSEYMHSTKPEMHNILQRRQRRTEPYRRYAQEICWRLDVWFLRYACRQTDGQTNKQTNRQTCSLILCSSTGRSNLSVCFLQLLPVSGVRQSVSGK